MIADRGQLGPDDFDALADLFLTEQPPVRRPAAGEVETEATPPTKASPAPPDAPSPGEALASNVEVVVLGHIPAMAASWASQYARLRAETLGRPVAMLRLGDKRARVELFGAPFQPPLHDVLSAVAAARAATSHVIVLPAPGTPAESGTLVEHASAVTLMTTPDEAGLVAAYGELKRLAPLCEAGSAGGPKPLRIVAVGAGAPKAQAACRRLQDAASSFLHVDMDASLFIERLSGGVAPVSLYDGAWMGTLDELVADLRRPGPVVPTDATRPRMPSPFAAMPVHDEVAPPLAPEAPAMNRPTPTLSSAAVPPMARPPSSFVEAAPMTRAAHSSVRSTVSTGNAGPASLVPGLSLIPARCPNAAEVDLAFDAEGRVHVVAMGTPGQEAQAVHALVVTAGWAFANRMLLGQVASRRAADAPAAMHLVTTNPGACRALLDSAITVHACVQAGAPIAAGAMVTVPMN